MRKKFFLLLLVSACPVMLWAQSIHPDQPIRFKVKNAGIVVDGSFADWEVTVDFDPKRLTASSIRGTANPASIDTGIRLRDKHLLGRQYFHTNAYPVIRLDSKGFRSNGRNAFIGVFDLQIRDVIKEVEIPFALIQSGRQRKFKGEFVIDRLEYGLGEKSLVLADEVTVTVEF